MFLAYVMNVCEEKMICDLAEYYHVFNYEDLPPTTVAVLVFGLRSDSRVMQHITEQPYTINQMLLAIAVDYLGLLCWSKTKDAENGRNKPKSIYMRMINDEEKESEYMTFESPEEYERFMKNRGAKNE